MSHDDAQEALSALLDDALDPAERVRVEAHLRDCGDCRRELDRLRQTVTLLRGLAPVRAPAGFAERVVAAAGPASGRAWPARLGRWLFHPLGVKLPLEAAAVLLVAVTALYVWERTPELRPAAGPELSREMVPARDAPPRPVASAPAGSAPAPPAPAAPPPAAPSPVASPPEAPPAPAAGAASALPAEREQRRDVAEPRVAAKKASPAEGKREEAGQLGSTSGVPTAAAPAPTAKATDSAAKTSEAPPPTSPAAPSRHRFATRALVAVDVSGRLQVADRAAGRAALDAALARLGVATVDRRPDPGAPTDELIELLVPRGAYTGLVEALGRLGQWQPDVGEAPELPDPVRMVIRLAG